MAEQKATQQAPAAAPPATRVQDKSELERLRDENRQLRAQLTAAGVGPRVQQPAHTFELSEGARQELAMNGQTNVNGVMRTREEVTKMLGDDQADVDLGDAEAPVGTPKQERRSAIRGVDFVYPSVEPGYIDPAVAGTPGINGPAKEGK